MDLSLSPDHLAILDALDGLARPYQDVPIGDHSLVLTSSALQSELAQGGFLDVAADPDLGTLAAAIIIERLARLPYTSDAAASVFFRSLLGDVTGPVCLMEAGQRQPMLRFLCDGATVILIGEDVRAFTATATIIRREPEALYGYPMASLLSQPVGDLLDISTEEARGRWRAGLAAESAGLMAAALKSVCDHTSQREQFGRPLASFQALRHRLAEAQVRTNGVYWLAMKAAATLDPSDCALAALHAQESARACVYDFHQFMGAMGMTLEHPLHLWTYRLKALASDFGGRGANALAAAEALWG